MSYYSANPHYAADDFSEDRARIERAEEVSSQYFADATQKQARIFNRSMADLRGLMGPCYDRRREFAYTLFKYTTEAASALCEITFAEMMADGEVSEATSYRWDELAVADAMADR